MATWISLYGRRICSYCAIAPYCPWDLGKPSKEKQEFIRVITHMERRYSIYIVDEWWVTKLIQN
jgi:hypothetical protein